MTARWAIFGAGAQGRIAADTLRQAEPLVEFAFVDDRPAEPVDGISVYPRQWLRGESDRLVLVAIGRNDTRLRVAGELANAGCRFGTLIHPSAVVMPTAVIEPGAFVMAAAVVNTGAIVRAHAIVNTAALVEHDCEIGSGASLSPGVVMGGRVRIGAGAFIGTGAVLCPRVTVGARAVIGAGAVVTRDVPSGVLAYGCPARVIRPVEPDRDWPKLM
jgi:sugar O-acyltransferase (sialic acid O-acetyltransferase NeuD family)